MNRALTTPRRATWVVAMTFLAFAALLSFAPKGEAAFSTPQCKGDDTIGRGASFARDAHGAFKLNFQFGFCNSAGAFPNVSYEALGSGAGRRAVGERSGTNALGNQSRNQPPRFGMTDEPPSTTGQAQMNQGTDAMGDEGTDEGTYLGMMRYDIDTIVAGLIGEEAE